MLSPELPQNCPRIAPELPRNCIEKREESEATSPLEKGRGEGGIFKSPPAPLFLRGEQTE